MIFSPKLFNIINIVLNSCTKFQGKCIGQPKVIHVSMPCKMAGNDWTPCRQFSAVIDQNNYIGILY